MSIPPVPNRHELEFGERLRALRVGAGFATGKALAEHLGWVAPKLSRIENGNQLASDADLVAWLDAVGASPDVRAELRDQLRELRLTRASWKRRLRTGNAPVQTSIRDLEAGADRIVMVDLFLVPGLAQTAEYARAVFAAAAELHRTPSDADTAVRERIRRQDVLYDPSKRVELIVTEVALRHPICTAPVMRGQLDRLANLASLDTVRFGVVPFGKPLPVVPMHGFWIVDDRVMVEVHHTELVATDPEDVALYNRITEQLWTVAVEGEQARALLAQIAYDLRQQHTPDE